MIRVLLADDHALVRAGIHSLLQGMREVQVVAEASSGEEGAALAKELLPDVVLMDLVMPGMDGVETTRRVKAVSPSSSGSSMMRKSPGFAMWRK